MRLDAEKEKEGGHALRGTTLLSVRAHFTLFFSPAAQRKTRETAQRPSHTRRKSSSILDEWNKMLVFKGLEKIEPAHKNPLLLVYNFASKLFVTSIRNFHKINKIEEINLNTIVKYFSFESMRMKSQSLNYTFNIQNNLAPPCTNSHFLASPTPVF
jgi:hypothetical protein